MDTLTQLIAKLQPLLLDNGTLFTTPTCTSAIRQALLEMNLQLPRNMATLLPIVASQYVYELTDALAGATPIAITDVLLENVTVADMEKSLDFDSYIEDERWFLRLRTPAPIANVNLLVRFTQAHTILGLDSATESTLPALYDSVLLDGAAAECCTMAAAGKDEANNLDSKVPEHYKNAAINFNRAFFTAMRALALRRAAPVSEPDARTWQDNYHSWTQ
jgi:hypothetical protein